MYEFKRGKFKRGFSNLASRNVSYPGDANPPLIGDCLSRVVSAPRAASGRLVVFLVVRCLLREHLRAMWVTFFRPETGNGPASPPSGPRAVSPARIRAERCLTSCLLSLEFGNQCAVIAYRFHRTILHCLLALAFLFRCLRLFEDE